MKRVDLHVHTTASDGTFSPAEAVRLARDIGLSAIAVTDHDTVSGFAKAETEGRSLGIEVVPGIEISTKYGGAVHILGYFIDPDCPELRQELEMLVQDRDERNRKIVKLMEDDGLPVTYEEMQRRFGEVIGRPHFAQILVELGLARDIKDGFERYVNRGQKYYLPRRFISIDDSIELIRIAGGVPVLAHPFQYKLTDAALRDLIEHCLEHGLMGMECLYSGYSQEQSAYLMALAKEYRLITTGGSDFHGANKPHIRLGDGMGGLNVPYEFLETLKAAAGR